MEESCYKKAYLHLFNRVTDALRMLEKHRGAEAENILKDAQIETEEIIISEE